MTLELCPRHFKTNGKMRSPQDLVIHDETSCPDNYLHINDCMYDWCGLSPDKWKAYLAQELLKPKIEKPLFKYNVHFTRNPKVGTRADWWELLKHTLRSKQFTNFKLLAMEHLDTNIHCHTHVWTKNQIDVSKFKSFTQNHSIKIVKFSIDHGVEYYFKKETKAFDDIQEFVKFYDEILK